MIQNQHLIIWEKYMHEKKEALGSRIFIWVHKYKPDIYLGSQIYEHYLPDG